MLKKSRNKSNNLTDFSNEIESNFLALFRILVKTMSRRALSEKLGDSAKDR